jgi:hypothetical protein
VRSTRKLRKTLDVFELDAPFPHAVLDNQVVGTNFLDDTNVLNAV